MTGKIVKGGPAKSVANMTDAEYSAWFAAHDGHERAKESVISKRKVQQRRAARLDEASERVSEKQFKNLQ